MTDKRGIEYAVAFKAPADKRGMEYSLQFKEAPPDHRGLEYSLVLKMPADGNRPFYWTSAGQLHGVVGYLKVGGVGGTQVQIT